MICGLSNNIYDCFTSVGGIKNIYLCEKENFFVTASTYSFDTIDGVSIVNDAITGLTVQNSFLYQFETNFDFVDTNEDESNGENYYSVVQTINFDFTKMEYTKRLRLNELKTSRLIAITEDNNGTFFLWGEDTGLKLQSAKSRSGRAGTDFNGYSFVLEGVQKRLARQMFITTSMLTPFLYPTSVSSCSAYAALTWGDTGPIDYFDELQNCLYSDFL